MATPYTLLGVLLCSMGQLLLLPGAQAKQGELEYYEPDFGDYDFPISTTSEEAQFHFNQGMAHQIGFNQHEARQSMARAVNADPNCPMCYWGVSYANGPIINKPSCSQEEVVNAYSASMQAAELATQYPVTPEEQALVDAMRVRFDRDPLANQTIGYLRYTDALRAFVEQGVDKDGYVASMLAESLMNLTPWNYYLPDGSYNTKAAEADEMLRFVLETTSNPFAMHLYIHLTEASEPGRGDGGAGRGEQAADDLTKAGLSGSGHLEHMPGHLFLRVGRYNDAILANQRACAADELYLEHDMRPYSPGHNAAFLVYAACMDGQRRMARNYTETMRRIYTGNPARGDAPGTDVGWNVALTTSLRFGDWQDVLEDSELAPEVGGPFNYAKLLRLYSEGVAYFHLNEPELASRALLDLQALMPSVRPSYQRLAEVAERVLRALQVRETSGDNASAIRLLEEAAALQDGWAYFEPPEWDTPLRQCIGQMWLNQGDYERADAVFRQDLAQFIENGWALTGLLEAMRGQPERYTPEEVGAVEQRLDTAWERADVAVKFACYPFSPVPQKR